MYSCGFVRINWIKVLFVVIRFDVVTGNMNFKVGEDQDWKCCEWCIGEYFNWASS